MNIKIKEVNSFTKEIEVVVAWEDLEKSYNLEFKKFRQKISMPGYRKGRVPVTLVKSNYGKSFEVDFIDKNLDLFFRRAVGSENLNPINRAEISDLDFSEGEEFKFTAKFEVIPDYDLPNYDKIKIKLTRYTPTQTDMDKSLEEMQNRFSNLKTLEEGAKSGDYVECDLQELDESGVAIIGKKQEGRFLRLGEGYIKGDAEKSLIGIKAEESRNVIITMDDDSKVSYDVFARKVQELIKPKVDDEFAKMADPNIENMDELKKKIQKQIDKSLTDDYNSAKQNEIINWFVDKTKFSPPTSMVNNYTENMIEDLKTKSPEAKNMEDSQLKEIYKVSAERQIKWYLIQKKLIDNEKINLSEDELKDEIQKQIDEFKDRNPDVKKYFKKPQNKKKFKEDLEMKKLFKKLESSTTIKESKKTTDELRKEQEKKSGGSK
ncbi:MAG: trigger factor [Candidatus Marinimicrobia bacterium]|nr:trigger factor [Candidatus Neomarinimicrobiota bacterium]